MKKILIAALLFSQLTADDFGFHIKDYTPPDFTRRELELQPDITFNQNYRDNYRQEDDDPARHTIDNLEELKVYDGLVYTKITNRKDVQQTDSLVPGCYLECRLDRDVYAGNYDHQYWRFEMGMEPEFIRNTRSYIMDDLFYEWNWSAQVIVMEDWTGGKPDRHTDWAGYWDIFSYISPATEVMIGMGRMEEVQDARLALYLFNAVKTAGFLSRDPGMEDITALATLLTELNTERRFDSRLHDIKAVSEIESFLLEKGLITSSGAACVMHIADIWRYGNGPVRENGWRCAAGPGVSAKVGWINTDFYSTREYGSIRGYLAVQRPLSNILQWGWNLDMKLSARHSGWDYEGNGPADEEFTALFETNGRTNFGLYLNTRTVFTASLGLEYRLTSFPRQKSWSGEDFQSVGHYLKGSLGFGGTYYLSPRYSLFGTYNLQISRSEGRTEYLDVSSGWGEYQTMDSRSWYGSHYFSAGFRYAFF